MKLQNLKIGQTYKVILKADACSQGGFPVHDLGLKVGIVFNLIVNDVQIKENRFSQRHPYWWWGVDDLIWLADHTKPSPGWL